MANKAKKFQKKIYGVILDNGLTWKAHIQHVRNKVSRSTGILKKCGHALTITSSWVCPILFSIHILFIAFMFWGTRIEVNLIV